MMAENFQLIADQLDLDDPFAEFSLQALGNFQEVCEELQVLATRTNRLDYGRKMKDEVIYSGRSGDIKVSVQRPGQADRLINPRFDLRNHSPTGFAWGYGGSGPAQLALAILSDYFGASPIGDILASHLYQDLKWKLIAHQAIEEDFFVTGSQIHEQLREIWNNDKLVQGWLDDSLRAYAFESTIREEENRDGDAASLDQREEFHYKEARTAADILIKKLVL
jgi:hypothetical protein